MRIFSSGAVVITEWKRRGFIIEKKISVPCRVVYLLFGFSGIVAIVKTGFWYGSVMATLFHTLVLIAAVDWGVVGVTGKDIAEWMETAFRKT